MTSNRTTRTPKTELPDVVPYVPIWTHWNGYLVRDALLAVLVWSVIIASEEAPA